MIINTQRAPHFFPSSNSSILEEPVFGRLSKALFSLVSLLISACVSIVSSVPLFPSKILPQPLREGSVNHLLCVLGVLIILIPSESQREPLLTYLSLLIFTTFYSVSYIFVLIKSLLS